MSHISATAWTRRQKLDFTTHVDLRILCYSSGTFHGEWFNFTFIFSIFIRALDKIAVHRRCEYVLLAHAVRGTIVASGELCGSEGSRPTPDEKEMFF